MFAVIAFLVGGYGWAVAAQTAGGPSRPWTSEADATWWLAALLLMLAAPLYSVHAARVACRELHGDAARALSAIRAYRSWTARRNWCWLASAWTLAWGLRWPVVMDDSVPLIGVRPILQWLPVWWPCVVAWRADETVESALQSWAEPEALPAVSTPQRAVLALVALTVATAVAGTWSWLDRHPYLGALGAALLSVPLLPPLFKWILGLQPLPDPALGRRLRALGRDWGVEFRNVLLWPTGGRWINAVVFGIWPQRGTLVLTDRLMTRLASGELEGLVAHEAAHLKRFHPQLRVVSVIVALVGATLLVRQMAPCSSIAVTGAIVGTVMFVAGVLILVARWTEYDADRHAQRLIGRAGEGLDFRSTLGVIAARAPESARASWLHPSIGRRLRALRD